MILSAIIGWGITILFSLIILYITFSPLAYIGLIIFLVSVEIIVLAAFLSITAFTKALHKKLVFLATCTLSSIITRYTITSNNANIISGILLALLILSGITAYVRYRSIHTGM